MKIQSLHIYPVKGLRGIQVEQAFVEAEGLKHDRRFMLVDKNGLMISQRTKPEMTQFETSLNLQSILVKYKETAIEIPFNQHVEKAFEVEVWGTKFPSKIVSPKIDQWFSAHLNTNCRLVALHEKGLRKKKFLKAPFVSDVSYADGYPILTLGTASMQTLNDKLELAVTHQRFRANIIIETGLAHEEDDWTKFKIGQNVLLQNIKPCVRCSVISIDPDTGTSSKEPAKTLADYRREGKGICFGSNVIVLQKGEIKVGDNIDFL